MNTSLLGGIIIILRGADIFISTKLEYQNKQNYKIKKQEKKKTEMLPFGFKA